MVGSSGRGMNLIPIGRMTVTLSPSFQTLLIAVNLSVSDTFSGASPFTVTVAALVIQSGILRLSENSAGASV